MPKNILIFSDGTGQVGGIHPDQRLSNIYKMYRAMRPGPSSPIKPVDQVCFYDPGLGAGEVGGFSLRRIKNVFSAALGSGIDENVVDCYEKIIAYYEPGDRILLFGFSRGAYTVRAVANVMNLCGIPTKMPDGSPVPRYGDRLRKVASDAVNFVYNHGNGYPRGQQPYFKNREELGKRFRKKYGSRVPDVSDEDDVQGNVQPDFIGVFDTVAALGSATANFAVRSVLLLLIALFAASFFWSWHWIFTGLFLTALAYAAYWLVKLRLSQFKYFSPDPDNPLKLTNPLHWWKIWKNGHRAVWNLQDYDKWLDSDVKYARHALAIDENRAKFPRVRWASQAEANKNAGQEPEWLKQVWFPGCHSDVGGSYLEAESRLSDIALEWMIDELKECVPDVQINDDMLVRSPDPLALQHEETYMLEIGPIKIPWEIMPREVDAKFNLHPSVIERLQADTVPQVDEVKPYRPAQLKDHPQAKKFYQ